MTPLTPPPAPLAGSRTASLGSLALPLLLLACLVALVSPTLAVADVPLGVERKADVAAFLTALEPGSVFFVDEIHRLQRALEGKAGLPATFSATLLDGTGAPIMGATVDLQRTGSAPVTAASAPTHAEGQVTWEAALRPVRPSSRPPRSCWPAASAADGGRQEGQSSCCSSLHLGSPSHSWLRSSTFSSAREASASEA